MHLHFPLPGFFIRNFLLCFYLKECVKKNGLNGLFRAVTERGITRVLQEHKWDEFSRIISKHK